MGDRAVIVRVVLLLVLCASSPAWACAVCGCGDPTLTAMGTEKPFKNRVRASLELRLRSDEVGREGFNRQTLNEQRLETQVAWAPHPRVFLLASLPVLRRDTTEVSLARSTTYSLGEAELRAKFFVFQDAPVFTHHLLAVVAGIKLPTAPVIKGLSLELQPGTGSVDPIVGFSYAYFAFPAMFYTSIQGTYPTPGREGLRAPPSLRTTTTVQYNVTDWFAPRMGIDTRLDGNGFTNGLVTPDTGGFIAFLTAEFLFNPIDDLLIFAALRVPTVQALWGNHKEGLFTSVGVAYDFDT